MEVITEDTIRRAVRKKELSYGGNFLLKKTDFLTPSAKSFLREKRISIITQSETIDSRKCDREPYVKKKTKHPINFLAVSDPYIFEIKHLINLLYFPILSETDFSELEWNFFRMQQTWLEEFCTSDTFSSPAEPLELKNKPLNSRQWQYYVGEIEYQMAKITPLIPTHKQKQWIEWASHFFNQLIIL